MRARRGVASLVLVPLIVIMAMLGIAPTAGAKKASTAAVSLDNVTGGQSALFVPLSNVVQFGQDNVFTSPISPAYLTFTLQEGPAVRFPISVNNFPSRLHSSAVAVRGYFFNWSSTCK